MTTRRPRLPMPEFMRAALEEAGLMRAYEARPDYQRNDYIGWITRAAREDTREKRLAQLLDELRAGDTYMKMAWQPGAARPRRAGPRNAPPADHDAYLAGVADADKRAALEDLRRTIHEAAPEAVEGISYSMPAFRFRGRPLVGFTAGKGGCTFHTMSPEVKAAFDAELSGYSTTKAGIHFTPDAPLPRGLVQRIVRARVAEIEGR